MGEFDPPSLEGWRFRLHEIIFEADTRAGKIFDITILVCILLSVTAVMLESVAGIRESYGRWLNLIEWMFTLLFTLEYILRLSCVGKPLRYARSFFGLVDLMSIVPTYLSFFFAGAQTLTVIRALRLLRTFRILKLGQFVGEAAMLRVALRASSRKIIIFMGTVLTLVIILGTVMYLVEGEEHGFDSIPRSIYWAIVTLTTVGYGDIAPETVLGRFLASIVMIIGYGIIAVPTGIVTVEIANAARQPISTQACQQCSHGGHDFDAKYCKFCGAIL